MHICIVTETYPPEINGVAMTLHRIAKELRNQGNTVTVVRPTQKSDHTNGTPPGETTVPGLPIPRYQGLRFGLPCGRRLRRLWRNERPDILYVATEGPLGLSAIRTARQLSIPATSGFHTNFHQYTRHYQLPFLASSVEAFLRHTHNRTLATFAPSNQCVEKLRAMGIHHAKLLGRGVDDQLFHPRHRDPALRAEWGIDPETGLVAIFVSRLAAEKNLALTIRAFERIRAQRPDTACVFVGDGPERARLAKKHPGFIFPGMKTDEELARHYASGDLFIFPSTTETYGNVVPEAMASGLIPVAYNYAAPRQLIRNGENGFLAPFDEDEAFVKAVDQALEHESQWPTIRHNARQSIHHLTWPSIVEDFARDLETARSEG